LTGHVPPTTTPAQRIGRRCWQGEASPTLSLWTSTLSGSTPPEGHPSLREGKNSHPYMVRYGEQNKTKHAVFVHGHEIQLTNQIQYKPNM